MSDIPRPPSTGGGLGYTLSKATQLWRAEVTEALRPWRVTVPQFLVIMELYRPARHGWAAPRQTEIGVRLGIDANTTSQIVRGLEARGILVREPDPSDQRARSLILTEAGLALAVETSAAARATNDRFFGVLTPTQEAALGELLDTVIARSRTRQKEKNT